MKTQSLSTGLADQLSFFGFQLLFQRTLGFKFFFALFTEENGQKWSYRPEPINPLDLHQKFVLVPDVAQTIIPKNIDDCNALLAQGFTLCDKATQKKLAHYKGTTWEKLN